MDSGCRNAAITHTRLYRNARASLRVSKAALTERREQHYRGKAAVPGAEIESNASAAVAHVATDASRAAFRPGQLGPVKAKFLTDAAYNTRIKGLARSAERNFRLSPFVMDYDHDWALPSLLVPVVEATSAVR